MRSSLSYSVFYIPKIFVGDRQEFCTLHRLDAHGSDFRVCYQSSEWRSTLSKLNTVESDWDKERTMLKIKKRTNQILKDAYDGRISLKGTQRKDQLLEGKKYYLGPLRDSSAPKYANYPNVEIREKSASHFATSRHSNLDLDTNRMMDLTRQSESFLSEAVSKKIKPNGSHVSKETIEGQYVSSKTSQDQVNAPRKPENLRAELAREYDKVLVVDNILAAKKVVQLLTTAYRRFVHACDTEVSSQALEVSF